MESIKKPAVVGKFYPSDPNELKQAVQKCLAKGVQVASVPKAIISPHAGYQFSGEIAGSAYAVMQHVKHRIKQVVLLGPSHYVGFNGFAIPSYTHFETPLGKIAVDKKAIGQVSSVLEVQTLDQAFENEHSLEVQLPFLQELFTDFTIVPILVGQAKPQAVAGVIAKLWGGPDTLIVISSDLSHYHDYNTAWKMDLQTTRAIELEQFENIANEQACGRNPIKGLLSLAREVGMTCRAIDVRNSGDTYGNKDRVVGYGAYHFYPTNEKAGIYNMHQKQTLLKIARNSIEHGLKHGKPLSVEAESLPFEEEMQRATFVSLYLENKLRGCVGSLQAVRKLTEDVAENAFKAAFADKRFQPLTQDELVNCQMSISILSPLSAIEFSSEQDLIAKIRPGIDGLILQDEKNIGTFLPMVWFAHAEAKEFWKHLKLKASLPEDHWSETIKVFRFTADTVH